jgi:hypothetical protein
MQCPQASRSDDALRAQLLDLGRAVAELFEQRVGILS